jgi:outer membrane protein TolC
MSREEQRRTVRLDVIRDAAVAYLNVLRAKTLERVEKDNLRLTRANLERALVRVSTGVANRSEEFRWRSEIANNRSRVLRTEANTQRAETALNRVLHRPLEERFRIEDTELDDPILLVSDPRIFTYVENPRNFRIYRDFITEEGVAVAPELLSLRAEIEAQKRILTATRRAFYLPTFSVQGEVTEVFAEGGEGKRDGQPIDDTDWSVGVFATFPLISGGDKYASYNRASEELSSLTLQYDARAERVGERIRSAMYRSGASYPNIQLSKDAADASNKNLELVTDQYIRGTVSIVDLLDAQNSALVANTNAENSVYDFLVDLMDVQRAAARFDFFMDPGEREAYFNRAEEFFRKAGIELRKK